MGYIRAEEILPIEVIELIQQYVDGENLYIPRKSGHRQAWGTGTQIKQEIKLHNGGLLMKIETQQLLIRDVKIEDKIPFVKMAADGSLNDCGFDKDCGNWITKWIDEARGFAFRDNPNTDYLAYTITLKAEAAVIGSVGCSYYEDLQETGITYFIGAQYRNNGYAVEAVKAYTDYFLNHYNAKRMIATVRDENIPSWKVIEKVGFILNEKRMYKDLNDDDEQLYRFYKIAHY